MTVKKEFFTVKRGILFLALAAPLCLIAVSSEAQEDGGKMEARMLKKTKDALMSYEIVEKRTDEILHKLEKSAFGEYAEKFAILAPIVTGKVQLRYKDFGFSYSHSSEQANVDYVLDERWRLFVKRQRESAEVEESSGVKYSFRF